MFRNLIDTAKYKAIARSCGEELKKECAGEICKWFDAGKLDDNWLLDVQLYSEEFRADLVSIWMDEIHIPSSQALRKLVRAYRKFFNAKDRRSRIAGLQGTVNTPAQLHLAVMAVICGLKSSQPAAILRAVLNAGLSVESNSLYAELVSYGAKDAFWAMVAQATGYSEVDVDLGALACHVLMTACTRTMNADNLAGLERYISLPHQAWCFDLVSDWLHSDEKQGLYVVARHVEEALRLHDRFMQMQVSELADAECFPCINECILEKLMQDVSHQIIDADAIAATVEKRRTCVWYDAVSAFYDGMMQVANMQRFFTEHAAGFGTDTEGSFIVRKLPDQAALGKTIHEKIFNGIITWAFHLISDLARSSSSPGTGTGIPGPLLATLKELSALPLIHDIKIHYCKPGHVLLN